MRKAVLLATLPMVALAGCGGSGQQENSNGASATATPSAALFTPSAAPSSAPSPAPSPALDSPVEAPAAPPPGPAYTPPPAPPAPPPLLTPEAEKGEKGARNVLLTWARALENHQFGTAWEQFGSPPASRTDYARWWQRYRTITVSLGDGTVEGAAGSLYYEVKATLTGVEVSGRPYRLEGPVIVRRVNDVDGATPAQLRWHIQSADLQTTH